jgi:hypothetical protein
MESKEAKTNTKIQWMQVVPLAGFCVLAYPHVRLSACPFYIITHGSKRTTLLKLNMA